MNEIIDGYIVNEDGEIVGDSIFAVRASETPLNGNSEEVKDILEKVLERRAKANAEIIGIRAQTQALMDNLNEQMDRRIRQEQRKIDYLDYAYNKMMESYLEENRGKQKSVSLTWGKIGKRSSTKTVIADETECMAWAMKNYPQAIKTEKKLLKSELPDDCPYIEKITEEKFYVEN